MGVTEAKSSHSNGRLQTTILEMHMNDLLSAARQKRAASTAELITYSPKVFIPLTMLCRDRCGYCTFAKPPARQVSAFLDLDQVIEIAKKGEAQGCHEALFTLGEKPELRYPAAASWLKDRGYASTTEYLIAACAAVLEHTSLLPHANPGALSKDELAALREVSASQGMMIESTRADLPAHKSAPDKLPQRRLATLEWAGELSIPYTTGILVGIGESRGDRIEALTKIAESHQRHGHVQEVIVQNFLPKPDTAMHDHPPCPPEELAWSIAAARLILAPEVHVQAPPNLVDEVAMLINAGISDLGGVSPVTIDHVNPERPWPIIEKLTQAVEDSGHRLAGRLTVHPRYVQQPDRWLDPKVAPKVLAASDAQGLARDHKWVSGANTPPPQLFSGFPEFHPKRTTKRVATVLAAAQRGERIDEEQMVTLFTAWGPDVEAIAAVADDFRRQANGDVVTFVRNRNINYTNVCTFKCKFCAFSKGPLSLQLRGNPYLLELSDIQQRVIEATQQGATEVCLQGGIHPDFDGDYYIDVCRAVHDVAPQIHIHGFTALEVHEGARRLGEPLYAYLLRLKDAGLKTLPGTAAEILDDEIRQIICKDKVNTHEWLEVHRVAHEVGLRSNVTIMFGSIENPIHWARHIARTRSLQDRTGGFTEFVPLPFVHMATPMFLQGKSRKGPTFREALLMHSVGRIAYKGSIDNIQASWVKLGAKGVRQVLRAGVNDLGGTLMDENISRAAGADHGQEMSRADFEALIDDPTRPLRQRTTLYDIVPEAPDPATPRSSVPKRIPLSASAK